MDVQAMQAAARARLAQQGAAQTDTFIDPTQERPLPIIVQRVVPKVDRAALAAHVLEGHQATFAIMLTGGRKIMFANYRFETDDSNLAQQIISEYAPRVWRV